MALRITKDTITPALKKLEQELEAYPSLVYKEFVKNTPIRTGYARRNTVLKTDRITANYQYATVLDEGYSKQAPRGMVEPTRKWAEQYIDKITRNK